MASITSQMTTAHSGSFRLALVHWFPLEQFPPAFNLLNSLAEDNRFELLCCTTTGGDAAAVHLDPRIHTRRTPFPARGCGRLVRLWRFLLFPLVTVWSLICFRPDAVIYIEPHSVPGVALYRLLTRCRVLGHYHEYRDPAHFLDKGNSLARIGDAIERIYLHHRIEWISHTNQYRINLFLRDKPHISPMLTRRMPNYPPAAWIHVARRHRPSMLPPLPLRLVYVGAVSIRDTWIRELLDWIRSQPSGRLLLDLYISTCDAVTEQLLAERSGDVIRVFKPGVSYDRLPELLPQYHVGLILYKGTTLNYIWNAPNKLFEYLLCGLDVWYPREMRGIPPEIEQRGAAGIVELDFNKLPSCIPEFSASQPAEAWLRECSCGHASRALKMQLLAPLARDAVANSSR